MAYKLKFDNCSECETTPGTFHSDGCDIERCSACGDQYAFCGCDRKPDDERLPWTGLRPGSLECFELDLWCSSGPSYVQCNGTDPGAMPDLNGWHTRGCPSTPGAATMLAEAKKLACDGSLGVSEKTAMLKTALRRIAPNLL